ncbi:MAG: hypothetical protein RL021_2062 [Bacteroidota bacterium]|jgi:D-glycero-D-manno-heptose 1,7-bisphosphate phosphatase
MSSEKKKAVFLDRDGVINEERGQYTWKVDDFRINAGVVEALLKLQSAGYLLIVVSNQGGIAKGFYSKDEVEKLHKWMIERLAAADIYITEVYYCPHHPDQGNCICRKPQSLLLEKACARFGIEAAHSWFIGDAQRDEEAGKAAGVRTVLIHPNEDLCPVADKILGAV